MSASAASSIARSRISGYISQYGATDIELQILCWSNRLKSAAGGATYSSWTAAVGLCTFINSLKMVVMRYETYNQSKPLMICLLA